MKNRRMTKKKRIITILLGTAVLLTGVFGSAYALKLRKIEEQRLIAKACEIEYSPRISRDGQFLISFHQDKKGRKLAAVLKFKADEYDFPVADTPHEYDGIPITEITREAFQGLANLQKVILPKTVKSIYNMAFANCKALKEVYIPASVEEITDNAFVDSPNVTLYVEKGSFAEKFACEQHIPFEYYTPKPLVSVPEKEKPQAVYMQQYHEKIVYDILYDSIGAPVCVITSFFAKNGEKDVIVPSQIDGIEVRALGSSTFRPTDDLTSVILPDTIRTISNVAFADCVLLEKVYIPESVSYIAEDAFVNTSQAVICAPKDSYAHEYAIAHKIPYEEWKRQ